MGEGHQHHHHHQNQSQLLLHHPTPRHPRQASRLGGVKAVGEIVEVQGGHIVRSTGRKDRHSKVCTAKGARDRRVRLAAHTAIQFYDVQDRLGYDRPSKAVDWLIKNAKAAIDELAELPPWHPTATTMAVTAAAAADPPPTIPLGESAASSSYGFGSGGSGFLPPSLESDAIADTIKFFFPVAAGSGGYASSSSSPPPMGFPSYPPDLLSRSNSHVQDLRLSLQSFQDPILLNHQHSAATHHHPTSPNAEHAFFSSSTAFDTNSAMTPWSTTDTGGSSGGGGGYMFTMPPPPLQGVALPVHTVLGQSPFLSQRGPLQSNNSPSILAWTDPTAAMHQSALSGSAAGYASGGFSGFRIPARIQGEEEQHGGGIANKPPSTPRR